MALDPIEIRSKVMAARLDLAGAEEALDEAIRDINARGRAEKQIIGQKLEAAFSRLHKARIALAELENLILPD